MEAFLGIYWHYRKCITNFAAIACPLIDLTKGKASSKFNGLLRQIDHLLNWKVYYVMNQYWWLLVLLGNVLVNQCIRRRSGRSTVPRYSREGTPWVLNSTERRHSSFKWECLAVKWAFYSLIYNLFSRHFILVTEHASFQWLSKQQDCNTKLCFWALLFQPFQFMVTHRPVMANRNAIVVTGSYNLYPVVKLMVLCYEGGSLCYLVCWK